MFLGRVNFADNVVDVLQMFVWLTVIILCMRYLYVLHSIKTFICYTIKKR